MPNNEYFDTVAFLRQVIEDSPTATLVYTGTDMVLTMANRQMMAVLGRGDSIIGRPMLEAVPELRNTRLPEHYQRVLSTGQTHYQSAERVELIRRGQSHWGYYDYTYKALRDPAGEVIAVVCTAVEVTDQVMARLGRAEAESRLEGAIDLAQLGTWSIEVDTGALSYSPRLIEWFGYDPAAHNYREVIPILSAEDQERVSSAVAHALDPASDGIYEETYTVIHPVTGARRVLRAQGKTVFDDRGQPVRMNGTAQDITIEHEMQLALELEVQQRTEALAASNSELAGANAELLRINKELEQFAYIASHDLQEPVRKISIFASMLERSLDPVTSRSQGYLDKISEATRRMTELIRDVLTYSQVDGRERELERVDLAAVMQQVYDDSQWAIEARQAIVTWDRLPVISALRPQITQVLANLLSNALKYARTDIIPQLVISGSNVVIDSRAHDRIVFQDNGIGFPQEYAERIFEVFQRLHSKHKYDGTGIGLALCNKIVRQHGGSIKATSSPGAGATFTILLPQQ